MAEKRVVGAYGGVVGVGLFGHLCLLADEIIEGRDLFLDL